MSFATSCADGAPGGALASAMGNTHVSRLEDPRNAKATPLARVKARLGL